MHKRVYIWIKSCSTPTFWYSSLVGRVIAANKSEFISWSWTVTPSHLSERDLQLVGWKITNKVTGNVESIDAEEVTLEEYLQCQAKTPLERCTMALSEELNNTNETESLS